MSSRLTKEDIKRSIEDADFARLKVEAVKASISQEDLENFEFAQAVCDQADLYNVYLAADAMGVEPSKEIKTIIRACVMAGAAKMIAVLKDGVDPGYLKTLKADLKRESGL